MSYCLHCGGYKYDPETGCPDCSKEGESKSKENKTPAANSEKKDSVSQRKKSKQINIELFPPPVMSKNNGPWSCDICGDLHDYETPDTPDPDMHICARCR